jgi:dihydrofolate reductase
MLIFNSLEKLDPAEFPNDIFICGGAQIYEQALPRCSDLYLTLVKREVEGDAFSRRLRTNSSWSRRSGTSRSSRFCITGTSRC